MAGTWIEPRSRVSNTRPWCPLHWLSYKTVDLKDTSNPMLQHETASSYKFRFNKTLASTDRNKNNNNRERRRGRERGRLQGYLYHFRRHFIKRLEKRQNVRTRAGKLQSREHGIRRTQAPKINSRRFRCVRCPPSFT